MSEQGDTDPDASSAAQSVESALFAVLQHPRRRAVVLLLAAADGQSLSISQLARQIATLEAGPEASTSQIRNVRTSLKRSHRDSLVTADIIAIEAGTVTPGTAYETALRTLANGLQVA